MASIGEKAISILAGNLNSGLSYLITTVTQNMTTDSEIYTNCSETQNTRFTSFESQDNLQI